MKRFCRLWLSATLVAAASCASPAPPPQGWATPRIPGGPPTTQPAATNPASDVTRAITLRAGTARDAFRGALETDPAELRWFNDLPQPARESFLDDLGRYAVTLRDSVRPADPAARVWRFVSKKNPELVIAQAGEPRTVKSLHVEATTLLTRFDESGAEQKEVLLHFTCDLVQSSTAAPSPANASWPRVVRMAATPP